MTEKDHLTRHDSLLFDSDRPNGIDNAEPVQLGNTTVRALSSRERPNVQEVNKGTLYRTRR